MNNIMGYSHSFRRFAFAFGPAFTVLYAIARAKDLAQDAATVYGRVPAMYWYGWTVTDTLGAVMLGMIAGR
jgi:hypothetical protein